MSGGLLISKSSLYLKKEKELYSVLERLNGWSQGSENAIDSAYSILEDNQTSMDRIAEIMDSQMTQKELKQFSKVNQDFIHAIIIKQKELIRFIKEQSKQLEQELGQMNHKSKAVKLYMNNEKSLFIDRDM